MSTRPIDYAALADQARKQAGGVDYANLAEKARMSASPPGYAQPKPPPMYPVDAITGYAYGAKDEARDASARQSAEQFKAEHPIVYGVGKALMMNAEPSPGIMEVGGALGPLATRGTTLLRNAKVAGQTAKNVVSPPMSGVESTVAKAPFYRPILKAKQIVGNVKEAYKAAERSIPDEVLKARNAARVAARPGAGIKPDPVAPPVDASPIPPPGRVLPSGRRVPVPGETPPAEAPVPAPTTGRTPRPSDEFYAVQGRMDKVFRAADTLHRQGVTAAQLEALTPAQRLAAVGKSHSEETFKQLLFRLRGLETGRVTRITPD